MVQAGPRRGVEPPSYFVVELDPRGESGLILAAGVFSPWEGEIGDEVRGYAVALLREFFRRKGNSLKLIDGGVVLRKILHHLDDRIGERWGRGETGLGIVLIMARPGKAFIARCGEAQVLLYREGEVTPAFVPAERLPRPLGCEGAMEAEVEELALLPGDLLLLEDSVLAPLIRPRDLSLIVQRATDLHRTGIFLAAIAERKGAESPFTALLWEVPNLQGDATFFGEAGAEVQQDEKTQPENAYYSPPMDQDPAGGAEQVKRRWLDRFRRRQG